MPRIDDLLAEAGLPPLPRTAWLEIDADALRWNLAAIRELAGPDVRVEPVVKADAYGHGLVPVAAILAGAGADGLSIATFDEARALREAGIDVPILVLYPIPPALGPESARLGISVTVGDGELLDRLAAVMAGSDGPPLGVQLEIETGLGRGGVDAADAAGLAARLRTSPGLRLLGVWSHLQAPEDDSLTAAQERRFERAAGAMAEGGSVPRHVAASGGLMTGAPVYEAVRPGLAMYGLQPDELLDVDPARPLDLRPVMALRARPVRVAELPAGWGISYGPTFVTERPSRIATLPLGYGDGWPRALSNRAEALVRGRRAPIVGNVAMDAVMVDVTDVTHEGEPPIGIDDVFTLIGDDGDERITAYDVARSRTTNSWEVVTSMARRLPRVYHAAARAVGLRSLTDMEGAWHGSNSGTGISATSRSTRS